MLALETVQLLMARAIDHEGCHDRRCTAFSDGACDQNNSRRVSWWGCRSLKKQFRFRQPLRVVREGAGWIAIREWTVVMPYMNK